MMTPDARQYAPATTRNRDPILNVLRTYLPQSSRVLEIASGTGEHGLYFSENLPAVWQPSDINPLAIASIRAWILKQETDRLLEPLEINVQVPHWWDSLAGEQFNAIVNINMIHIAPWASAVGLFQGVKELLPTDGLLYLYGPFKQHGVHTSESNAQFDLSLRSRDSSWGIKNLEEVIQLGSDHDLTFQKAIAMPANNLSVIFTH